MRISSVTNCYNTQFLGIKDIQKGAKAIAQTAQTQIRLGMSSPLGMYNSCKVLSKDPEAFKYGLFGRVKDVLVSKDVLGAIQLQKRGKKDTAGANILRFIFEDGSKRYSVRRLGETLAYADVAPKKDGSLLVKYLCNIEGRERFRALERTVLQAAVEDSINQNGIIPAISAFPAQVGNLSFDRAKLYKMMGAQVSYSPFYLDGKLIKNLPDIYCTQDTIIKRLDNIAKRDNFIFPETKANFERLKNGSKENN